MLLNNTFVVLSMSELQANYVNANKAPLRG